MAMNPDPRPGYEHGLPCGRSVEQVWSELEAGSTTAHTASCPHCTTARSSLVQLMEATQLLVDEPLDAPAGMLDRIMGAIRADLLVTDSIELPPTLSGPVGATPAPGFADISVPALASVLRYVVDTVEGIRAQRCRIEQDPQRPYAVKVDLSVSLRYTGDAAGTPGRVARLDDVRDRVHTVLARQVGLELTGLDIEVADVWTDHAADTAAAHPGAALDDAEVGPAPERT